MVNKIDWLVGAQTTALGLQMKSSVTRRLALFSCVLFIDTFD